MHFYLAQFDELSWKVITQKLLYHSSAEVYLWAPERSRIINPTRKDFSWGSDYWHTGDVASLSKKSTVAISFEGLNGKTFEEASR
jgi:hypothetical protein